jgi:hypothetical protein
VKKVLNGEDAEPEEVAAAVLIIVYRFRNNLFHGVKWSVPIRLTQTPTICGVSASLLQTLDVEVAENA